MADLEKAKLNNFLCGNIEQTKERFMLQYEKSIAFYNSEY